MNVREAIYKINTLKEERNLFPETKEDFEKIKEVEAEIERLETTELVELDEYPSNIRYTDLIIITLIITEIVLTLWK